MQSQLVAKFLENLRHSKGQYNTHKYMKIKMLTRFLLYIHKLSGMHIERQLYRHFFAKLLREFASPVMECLPCGIFARIRQLHADAGTLPFAIRSAGP